MAEQKLSIKQALLSFSVMRWLFKLVFPCDFLSWLTERDQPRFMYTFSHFFFFSSFSITSHIMPIIYPYTGSFIKIIDLLRIAQEETHTCTVKGWMVKVAIKRVKHILGLMNTLRIQKVCECVSKSFRNVLSISMKGSRTSFVKKT